MPLLLGRRRNGVAPKEADPGSPAHLQSTLAGDAALTFNDGGILEIADGGSINNVADNEPLDGLVLGDHAPRGLAAHALDLQPYRNE